jgi:hypothetical protein
MRLVAVPAAIALHVITLIQLRRESTASDRRPDAVPAARPAPA